MRIRRLSRGLLLVVLLGPLPPGGAAEAQSPALLENLKNENVDTRRSAAKAIRLSDRKDRKSALAGLIDRLMTEKDGQVRLAVLDAITSLGPEAEPAIPALLHTLRTDSGGQRSEETHQDYRSALALAAIGQPAVEGLVEILKEKKENVRAEAVMALGRIGADASPAVPGLIPLLGDKSERIRREAAHALGQIGQAATVPLIAAATHQDAVVRAGAIEGLGLLPAPNDRARDSVVAGSKDEAPEVRAASLKAMGRLGLTEETLAPILRTDLEDQDEGVRLAAVALLVGRRGLLTRMAPDFESLLTAEQEGVAHDAAFLLGKLGPEAFPRLLDALRLESSRVDLIAGALARGGRPAVSLLHQVVGDANPRVRRGAALALGMIRPLDPSTVETLTTGLNDPDPSVKAAFLASIAGLGPRAKNAVPVVRNLLRDDSPAVRIQSIDVLSLAAPRDEQQLSDLLPLLDDSDPKVQKRAIDAIRNLGPIGRSAVSKVVGKLATSPDQETRLAALEFLGSHGSFAEESVPAVTALLDDPSTRLRTVAVQVLGKMGKAAQPALDRLTSLLGEDQVEIRESVASVVGNLGLDAEIVRPALARAIQDKEQGVRRAALSAIFRLGPEGSILIPDLILLASREGGMSQSRRMLRRFERDGPNPKSVPELTLLLENDQQSVRLLATKFLGLAGAKARESLPALERLRDDPSEEVRKEAETALDLIKKATAAGNP